jgi:glycosyltransferase involved in cell wall biosynthesis
MMRILVAHHVPKARTGGMSRLMGLIHDRVASAGHDVDLFCSDDVPASWSGAYGRRVAFPFAVRAKATQAAADGRPYDIINVHEPIAAPSVIGRGRGPRVVVTSHGLERRAWALAKEESRLGREGPAWRTRLTYPVGTLWPGQVALRQADHVFCLNEEDRSELVDRLGRASTSVTRIFPGADELYSVASRSRDYQRAERILFPATWRKNKGIEDLVPAFVTLAERHRHLSLHVVGSGQPAHVVHAAFPSALRDRIECETPATEEAMAAAFSRADLFLLPSLFEGTPLTLVQAMMSGLPIVTTATCGMKDVVRHGESGLLVSIRSPREIVSAVESLIADASLRCRLGQSAAVVARWRFTWDRVAEPVLRAYESLGEHDVR